MTRPAQNHQGAIRSIERLHRILEAAKLLNSTLDLAELTAIILRIIRDEVASSGEPFLSWSVITAVFGRWSLRIEGEDIVVRIRLPTQPKFASPTASKDRLACSNRTRLTSTRFGPCREFQRASIAK